MEISIQKNNSRLYLKTLKRKKELLCEKSLCRQPRQWGRVITGIKEKVIKEKSSQQEGNVINLKKTTIKKD